MQFSRAHEVSEGANVMASGAASALVNEGWDKNSKPLRPESDSGNAQTFLPEIEVNPGAASSEGEEFQPLTDSPRGSAENPDSENSATGMKRKNSDQYKNLPSGDACGFGPSVKSDEDDNLTGKQKGNAPKRSQESVIE